MRNMESAEETGGDAQVYAAMLAEDRDVFVRFFDKSVVVDENFASETRERTIQVYNKYSQGRDFDDFILRVHRATWCEISEEAASRPADREEECERTILGRIESLARPREEFNVTEFIVGRNRSREYAWLDFDSDEEVREELSTIGDSSDRAADDLRTMLQVISMLNRMHWYHVLYIPMTR